IRHDSAADATTTSTAQVEALVLHFQVGGFPSPTVAGSAGSFTVTALDQLGETVTGYRGTAHFTSSDAQAVLPADYAFTAADNGVHTFSATLKTAGTQSITAADPTAAGSAGSQSGIVVTPAAASALALIGVPTAWLSGDLNTFTVAAKDAY